MSMTGEELIKRAMLIAGIIMVAIISLVPLMWMVAVSFSETPDFPLSADYRFTIRNYSDILNLENLHFPDYLRNSLVVAGVTAILSTVVGALAAYAISRTTFSGKMFIILSVLALSMFPPSSTVIGIFGLHQSAKLLILDKADLLNPEKA